MQKVIVHPLGGEDSLNDLVQRENENGFKLDFLEFVDGTIYTIFDDGKPVRAKKKK
jgi:hypothetical protein